MSKHEQPLYWVRRTALRKLMALRDRQKHKRTVSLENLGLEVAEPASSHDAEMVLQLTLSQLPVRQRAVLALTVEGATDEEIAVQLDLAITTVRTYKADVRRKYRGPPVGSKSVCWTGTRSTTTSTSSIPSART
ncbi:hypothetical protein GCM10009557_04200 [Virgisporangium ochraceum]|uniref:HTH luxR-type domain-containing protein n=1 Tax=Virgisporangium ochraceum TaxID=65505 RepID=A0A8J4EBD5_9ACTN|nr:LuxR family transcriptional regulator [Virgisporangium ochraceum]GIJ65727.1 hypothetical protein Voc01_006440 [Virgisporangium ochraceum]